MSSIKVYRSTLNGVIEPPPSKSYTHRAIAIASLAEGKSNIISPLLSRDTIATINACKTLGATIINGKNITIYGKNEFEARDREINAENSGTTIRISIAMSALVKDGKTILTGDSSLRRRPMQPLIDALRELGVRCYTTDGKPPVIVYGGGIKGGVTNISGSISSQFISALLISSIYAKEDVTINVINEQVSKPYIDSTISVMNRFNVNVENDDYKRYYITRQSYRPTNFRVPTDMSSTAILLGAGALLGEVDITNLDLSLPQGDARIIDILKSMDADISVHNDNIKIKSKELSDGEFDLRDTPDLLPVLTILALKAKHVRVKGVEHARVKESDRISILANELRKLGVEIREYKDGLDIRAPKELKSATLNSYDDHRLFMVFTIAAMLTENSIVEGVESVDVSYPNFINDIIRLGGKISK